MRTYLVPAFTLLVLVAAGLAAEPPSETQKIEALIERIESLEGAVFMRNGREYTGEEAAEHLRFKWSYARGRVKTARQFIENIASRSSRSGEAYMIRFADGRQVTSEAYLAAELEKLAPGPATRPATRPASRPAEGDPGANADRQALEIARAVLKRLGGRAAWERSRILTWNFFRSRRHLWDRHTGDVRIEGTDRESGAPYLILMNLNTRQGRAWKDGTEVTDRDALAGMLKRGVSEWINDSYWLVMPYKLLDPGVTLEDLGERPMTDGRPARVLELTFADVGETPRNKYHVYVAADTGLVEQWDFYTDRDDADPSFQIPWRDWKRYGEILLSGDRGEMRGRPLKLSDIAVLDDVPRELFATPAPVDWERLAQGAD